MLMAALASILGIVYCAIVLLNWQVCLQNASIAISHKIQISKFHFAKLIGFSQMC